MKLIFQEWQKWWSQLSFVHKVWPITIVVIYSTILATQGGIQPPHLMMIVPFLLLAYSGPKGRPAFHFVLPFLVTGVLYDSQHYYLHLIRGSVHVEEPFLIEKYYFGISTAQGTLIPSEWFQLHTHWVLDLFAGIAYVTYVAEYMLIAAFFFFIWPRHNSNSLPMPLYFLPWAFFIINILGFITYHVYPAAPPWYVTLHGFEPVTSAVPPNPAGANRFDDLIGLPIFNVMYSQAANAFGAIPSLHVAYPLLSLYFAIRFRTRWLATFCLFFYFLVCFAAIYLNHHYVIDIIFGSIYAIGVMAMIELSIKQNQFINLPFLYRRRFQQRHGRCK